MPLYATILVNVERGATDKVAQSILDIKGVEQVFSVAGRFDLIVQVKVASLDQLSEISNNQFDAIGAIRTVETLVSMKVYSDKVLQEGFSVGS